MITPSTSPETVLGYRYKTQRFRVDGEGYVSKHIFIPSHKINIKSNGETFGAERAEKPHTTKTTQQAMALFQHEKLIYLQDEYDAKYKEEQKKSLKEVQVPLKDIQEMMSMLEKEEELEKQQRALYFSIKDKAKQIFSNNIKGNI